MPGIETPPAQQGARQCPCENVCEFCDVFFWRALRSSRVSRDLEKMFSRFLDVGFGLAALGMGTGLGAAVLNTRGRGFENLVITGFIN
jgi:hypothetical protein